MNISHQFIQIQMDANNCKPINGNSQLNIKAHVPFYANFSVAI